MMLRLNRGLPAPGALGVSRLPGDDRDHLCQLGRGGARAEDLGKLARVVAAAGTPQQLQVTPLGRQPGTAAHGPDRERRQGHPEEQTVAAVRQGLAEAHGILGHAGGVLAGGEIKGREQVCQVRTVAQHADRLRGR